MGRLQAAQTITVVNRTGTVLSTLPLVVEANRLPGSFELLELKWPRNDDSVGIWTIDGAVLELTLPARLAQGETVVAQLRFEVRIPGEGGPIGRTSRQINLGDWYPFVPVYQADRGWLIHDPAAVGEHTIYDVADFVVKIEIEDQDRLPAIAAAALLSGDSYKHASARNFALSVGHDAQVLHTSGQGVDVRAHVFPEHLVAGKAALDATARAVDVFSERFGAYGRESLTLVEAEFPDGLEFDGLYFIDQAYFASHQGGHQDYLTAIAVHETAHQWWYGRVGNDPAREPWLDEALATYSEVLYYETVHPELVDWWWQFRVERFQPTGFVDSTTAEHAAFRPYVNAVYLRGAQFLQALRDRAGDDVFFSILREYAATGKGRQMTAANFFAICRAHGQEISGTPLAQFFRDG